MQVDPPTPAQSDAMRRDDLRNTFDHYRNLTQQELNKPCPNMASVELWTDICFVLVDHLFKLQGVDCG